MSDKQGLRERTWDALNDSGDARFPFPPHGRIPNFAGASDAAARLADLPVWAAADRLKCNPDAPQRAVRRRALVASKTVYVAVPRLRAEKPFLELDPDRIDDVDHATTIRGADELGRPVAPEEMGPVDLVVAGSVAVTSTGARVGKGEGYSDLEWGVLVELGLVGDDTTVATTVHELQLVDEEVPVRPHDVPLDLVATPERVVHTETQYDRPTGIAWDALPSERLNEIPILRRLSPE
ncbi:MAG: 5-formyltetrahydrofolate cyclo-ligase [Halobacteriota archaeon]